MQNDLRDGFSKEGFAYFTALREIRLLHKERSQRQRSLRVLREIKKAHRTSWVRQNDPQDEISKKALRTWRALREIKKAIRTSWVM